MMSSMRLAADESSASSACTGTNAVPSTSPNVRPITLRQKVFGTAHLMSATGPTLSAEADPAAGCRNEQLVRHLLTHCLNEVIAAAMHGNYHIRIERFDFADDLVEIILRRRSQMESAHQCVDLLHAGHCLCLPCRIDNADVTAGADHDEAAILHVEAGCVLVRVLVRDNLSLQLGRREMARIAAKPVLHA